eukprot:CAMPEP_0181456880 /NCGR_PEP_ID=MMETSP1110-20121109/31501_1 /TAXON_ID=174948 /ORGANISM="Symbiodinium sp., Strain CCMP421" /LENGTH=33 /DNA_ID= /DNA_START= /DNA_END= /DNA_ORIENTATION=
MVLPTASCALAEWLEVASHTRSTRDGCRDSNPK